MPRALPRHQLPEDVAWLVKSGSMGKPFQYIASKARPLLDAPGETGRTRGPSSGEVATAVEELRSQGVKVLQVEALLLHASQLDATARLSHFWGYAALAEKGVLIIASTREQLAAWWSSRLCQAEVAGIPLSRLFLYLAGTSRLVNKGTFDERHDDVGFAAACSELFYGHARAGSEVCSESASSRSTLQTRAMSRWSSLALCAGSAARPGDTADQSAGVSGSGAPDELEELQEQFERCVRKVGEHDWQVAAVLEAMGACHEARGNLAEALCTYDRAMAIQRRLYGEESDEVGACLHNIGRIREVLG